MPIVDDNVEILYNSTVEGAMLSLWCRNSTSATIATCNDDGTWRPSPTALVDEMCVNGGYRLIRLLYKSCAALKFMTLSLLHQLM